MGPDPTHRFRWGIRPGFVEVLSGATGRAISALGFSNKRPGQVASGLRLVARRAARSLIGVEMALKLPESQLHFAFIDAAAPMAPDFRLIAVNLNH